MSKRSKRQPVYLRVAKLVDPDTGNVVPALVPAGAADRSVLRDRGLKTGAMVRADVTRPRNPEFHRLAHALGNLVRGNIDGFERYEAHGALKKLQQDSGHGCEETIIEVPGMGSLLCRQPRSVAFDCMDQSEFYQLMRNLCRYIAETYWPQCTPEQVEQMVDLMPLEESA